MHRYGQGSEGLNVTDASDLSHLPPSILNAIIPGYDVISKILLDSFGFDVSNIVPICIVLFLLHTGFSYIYRYSRIVFEKYLTASITVDYYDEIYDHILAFVADLHALKRTRSLRAQSGIESAWDGYDVDELKAGEELAEGQYFNFNNWEAKVPPRFEPHGECSWFWHRGHYIQFHRDKDVVLGGFMKGMLMDQEKIKLTVLGRSTQPLKDFIIEARDRYLSRESAKTVVRRPSPKEHRGRGGRQAWVKVSTRPSRPMATVVLDAKQKAAILKDINEYLHPATPRWYSNRGIPYRRGYLLHGPPGTGKTSLSFAIAGVFGLDIYCISLLEPTLTEEELGLLFNSLPRRCVVLLEDIDSAGLYRKKTEAEEEAEAAEEAKKEGKDGKDSSVIIAKEVAKAFRDVNSHNPGRNNLKNGPNTNGISLSGLLNAIDGVASHEGRVLIMTTNLPEKLDEALIRPGRVDMKIEFTKATKDQIRQLYLRMYCSDANEHSMSKATPQTSNQFTSSSVRRAQSSAKGSIASSLNSLQTMIPNQLLRSLTPPATPTSSKAPSRSPTPPRNESSKLPSNAIYETADSKLDALANKFADALPPDTFSPAEIQGFLLTRKKDPELAVQEVATWRDSLLESKNKGVKGAAVAANTTGVASTRANAAEVGAELEPEPEPPLEAGGKPLPGVIGGQEEQDNDAKNGKGEGSESDVESISESEIEDNQSATESESSNGTESSAEGTD